MSTLLFTQRIHLALGSSALCLMLTACISHAPRPAPASVVKPTPVIKPKPPVPSPPLVAGSLAVYATNSDGIPLAGAAIYLQALTREIKDFATSPTSGNVIDLIDHQFQPHLLIVHSGSAVVFNNLDKVEHQIYSFSTDAPLNLDLRPDQSRRVPMPAHAAVVTLGCKIYNQMLGYVLVTDAAVFGITDTSGFMRFSDLPPGEYRIKLWYADPHNGVRSELSVTATVAKSREQLLRLTLK